jgi:hypothetical protein
MLIIVLISLFGFSKSKFYINNEIEKANYCDVKEDCVSTGSKCPFGCYIYVNKNEVNRIKNLISSFKSNCVYNCMYCPDVECKNNKCEPICK